MTTIGQTQLFTLVLVVLIVGRFLARELRARTVRLATLWVRPAILIVLTGFLATLAISLAPGAGGAVALAIAAGAAIGVAVGWLVTASTHIERSEVAGRVRLRGSWVTVVIWVVALGARFLVRSALGGSGAESAIVNTGLVALVAAAFATIAVLVRATASALN